MPLLRTVFCLIALVAIAMTARADPLLTYPLKLGPHTVRVEVAATPEERQTGLMHRRSLGEGQGMVFVFERTGLWGMWMKNTFVPLSVAFIDEQGRILNIEDMEPHTEDSHNAVAPARYALEMSKGWFARRGIRPGQKVEGLKRLPKPR